MPRRKFHANEGRVVRCACRGARSPMIFAAIVVALLVGAPAAQRTSPNAGPTGTVTHDGCVVASPTMKHAFTLDDDGRTYILKGVDVRDMVGRHVELARV